MKYSTDNFYKTRSHSNQRELFIKEICFLWFAYPVGQVADETVPGAVLLPGAVMAVVRELKLEVEVHFLSEARGQLHAVAYVVVRAATDRLLLHGKLDGAHPRPSLVKNVSFISRT